MNDHIAAINHATGTDGPVGPAMKVGSTPVNLPRRRMIIAWFSLGTALIGFILLVPSRGLFFSLQFSICLALLFLIGFRWWTSPVHPGAFGYFSPHTIILLNGLIFYGLGNLFPLILPDQVLVNYGAVDYYLPVLAIFIAGLIVFDLVYRVVAKWQLLNLRIERRLDDYFSPEIQGPLPFYALLAYLACWGIFIHMTGEYLLAPFKFEGAISETANIFARTSSQVLSVVWALMSIIFFRNKGRVSRTLVIAGLLSFIPIFFAFQSRRLIFFCCIVLLIIYMLYNWERLRIKWFVLGVVTLILAFMTISMVKMTQVRDPSISRYLTEDKNIFLRTEKILQSEEFGRWDNLRYLLLLNAKKRVAALDFPGAIMDAHISKGIPLMYGEHNLLGAAKIIPRSIWPEKPKGGVEDSIIQHYELGSRDQLITFFASAYADWGIMGVLGGGAFLAIFFGIALRLILIRTDGILVYLLSLYVLLSKFQLALLMSVLFWFRWVCIIMVINTIVFYIYRIIFSSKK